MTPGTSGCAVFIICKHKLLCLTRSSKSNEREHHFSKFKVIFDGVLKQLMESISKHTDAARGDA